MARLTLRLPEGIYRRLKERQHATGGSMNDIIVAAVDRALNEEQTEVEDERQRIKAAMGDLVVEPDLSLWPTSDQPLMSREELLASLPRFEHPISQDIIEDRGRS